MKLASTAVFLTLCLGLAVCFSSGPPSERVTCIDMRPGTRAPHKLQDGNGTYDLRVDFLVNATSEGFFAYEPGTTYTGTITSATGIDLRGYLVQAVDPSEARIGEFGTQPDQRHLACSSISSAIPDSATLVHSTPNTGSVSFTWQSPGTAGMVDFRYTIVRSRTEYFGPLSAGSADRLIQRATEPEPFVKTVPTRNPANYRITARNPPGCEVADCSVFVGIDSNAFDPRFLDIYLEGDAQGWVAVGFSESPSMFAADVIGCNIRDRATNLVEAVDTWNPRTGRDNSADTRVNAFPFSRNYSDGRLRCIIGREITTTDTDNDLNLNASLYLLYGFSNDQTPGALSAHRVGLRDTPEVTRRRVNPASDTADFQPERVRSALTRLHGILMWLAWPVIGVTGMFFAFFMRPALPNGEWFQAHRALMVLSLIVGSMGFFFIFVAQYRRQPNPGLINFNTGSHIAHFVLGLITMLLQIINPLIALCRCKPDSKHRWIFNSVHGYGIGIISLSLSLTTVGIGTGIFNAEVSSLGPSFNIFWVFIAYVVLYTVVVSIGYNIIFWGILPKIYGNPCSPDKPSPDNHEMEQKGVEKKEEINGRKPPSKDSNFRWIAFALFAIVNVLFGFAMIILIAI